MKLVKNRRIRRAAKILMAAFLAGAVSIATGIGRAYAQVQAAANTNAAELPSIWPTLFALLVVIAAIVIFGWLMKKLNPASAKSGQLLRQVSQMPLGPKERVVVVAFQSQWLVLGVTAHSIQLLSTTDVPPPENGGITAPTTPAQAASFTQLLKSALGRQPGQST